MHVLKIVLTPILIFFCIILRGIFIIIPLHQPLLLNTESFAFIYEEKRNQRMKVLFFYSFIMKPALFKQLLIEISSKNLFNTFTFLFNLTFKLL